MTTYSYDRIARVAEPTEANLGHAAASFAYKAFAKGERWGGGNNTTYPRKWYDKLEEMFGVLNAKQLAFFNAHYDHHMAQLTLKKGLPPPPTRIGSTTAELARGDEVTFVRAVKTKWGLTVPKGTRGVVKTVGRLVAVTPRYPLPSGWTPGEAVTWPDQKAALKDVRPT